MNSTSIARLLQRYKLPEIIIFLIVCRKKCKHKEEKEKIYFKRKYFCFFTTIVIAKLHF